LIYVAHRKVNLRVFTGHSNGSESSNISCANASDVLRGIHLI
jgi:uncharacterized protein YsxB (DUF464 family)